MADHTLQETAALVEREREAHEVQDVLAESWKLKRRFPHSLNNPAHNALHERFHSFLVQANHKDVLDYGCGRGEYAMAAARAGGNVVGIDISEPYIEFATQAAASETLKGSATFRVMDAHNLAFDDDTFDLVIGNGILHHLQVMRALSEIRRVLRPGGIAVFQEPLADSPLLKVFRALTPRARTLDEAPFSRHDLTKMSEGWVSENQYYGLVSAPVSMITSIIIPGWPNNPASAIAHRAELALNRRHIMDNWNQYVLIQYRKPEITR